MPFRTKQNALREKDKAYLAGFCFLLLVSLACAISALLSYQMKYYGKDIVVNFEDDGFSTTKTKTKLLSEAVEKA